MASGDALAVKANLQAVFTAVMKCSSDQVATHLSALVRRLQAVARAEAKQQQGRDLDVDALILRLHSQYPGDVGLFAPFLLNAFELQPGEAIFLGANEPHAYLDGDCVEAMACSDNVVRAGLTPKLRDVDTLCSMLTYVARYPDILTGSQVTEHTRRYAPPVDEFQVHRTAVPAAAKATPFALEKLSGPSLALVYEGECKVMTEAGVSMSLKKGNVVAIPGCQGLSCEAAPGGILLYRCAENKL